uniref:Protein kinase domain-containing protein n=1 Tax=Parascaris univalens TaxID=6257 RepID=A0A915CH95_PARUN
MKNFSLKHRKFPLQSFLIIIAELTIPLQNFFHSDLLQIVSQFLQALTSFTYLGDSRRHLTWMNTREQFDKYFQSSRFDYNSQVQAVFPPELFVAREILRIIGEIDQNPVPHDVGKYILIVTAYELYLRAKITENIRNRLGESRIHVKIIEFDDYNGDSTNSDSAENFLILITENEKIIELDRIDELFNAQLAANVFPCHDRRIDDEISMRVEHEGSNHMHKVAYSNGYEYGANSRADDDESDARDSFWDTPWPYVIGGAILIVLTTISMCFFIIRHSRSLRTNRRIGEINGKSMNVIYLSIIHKNLGREHFRSFIKANYVVLHRYVKRIHQFAYNVNIKIAKLR